MHGEHKIEVDVSRDVCFFQGEGLVVSCSMQSHACRLGRRTSRTKISACLTSLQETSRANSSNRQTIIDRNMGVLLHLEHQHPQLASLDMNVVSEESKAFANTVFLKKSMYYNMRSRIVKRHAGHVIRKVNT